MSPGSWEYCSVDPYLVAQTWWHSLSKTLRQYVLAVIGSGLALAIALNQSQDGIRRVIAVGLCCGEQVARSCDGRNAGCTEAMEVGPQRGPAAGVSRPDTTRAGALARAVAAGGRLVGR